MCVYLGRLACPQTPDPEIGSECSGALGPDFGFGGNVPSHCSGSNQVLSLESNTMYKGLVVHKWAHGQ